MKLSEEFKKIKEKYQPKNMDIKLTPCSSCVHSLKLNDECQRCGQCGRYFEDGELVIDVK